MHYVRMKQAVQTATFSKCVSRHVGALILVDGRIASEGYNGTPKGYMNCNEKFHKGKTEEHHDWSLHHEIHAEMNAIIWAARKGVSIEGGIMFTTTKPCRDCTKHIIAAGIKEIYWMTHYPFNDDVVIDKFLNDMNVKSEQIVINKLIDEYPQVYGVFKGSM